MEIDKLFTITDFWLTSLDFCHSCFCRKESVPLQKRSLKHSALLAFFRDRDLTLCPVCKKQADYFESFVKNVSQAQKLFQDVAIIETSILHTIKAEIALPTKSLTKGSLESIQLGFEPDLSTSIAEGDYIVYSHSESPNDDVKLEVKQENLANDLDDGVLDEDDFAHHDIENEANLQAIKQEIDGEELDDKNEGENHQKGCENDKLSKELEKRNAEIDALNLHIKVNGEAKNNSDADYCDIIRISREECQREREQMAQEEKYLRKTYKCQDCIKGFQYKATYDKHMESHKQEAGKYVCNVCKQRQDTYAKLKFHKKYHEVRYRCRECGLTRSVRETLHEHYVTAHTNSPELHICPVCCKSYKRAFSLRKHVRYVHGSQRVACDYCQKIYANKTVLRKHILETHMKREKPLKPCVCETCGMRFEKPCDVKKHMTRHTDKKDFYCVECDKSFKAESNLKRHLKITARHVKNKDDLHFPCLHCEKRFAVRRTLNNHMNSQHLNVKPYQCDKCDRSYVQKSKLKDHQRLAHDGYKRPLAFPCPMCDKVFDQKVVCQRHIRTHTGERPYACASCPASFAQGSVLRTHIKLVHLNLTRDGRAKPHRKIAKSN